MSKTPEKIAECSTRLAALLDGYREQNDELRDKYKEVCSLVTRVIEGGVGVEGAAATAPGGSDPSVQSLTADPALRRQVATLSARVGEVTHKVERLELCHEQVNIECKSLEGNLCELRNALEGAQGATEALIKEHEGLTEVVKSCEVGLEKGRAEYVALRSECLNDWTGREEALAEVAGAAARASAERAGRAAGAADAAAVETRAAAGAAVQVLAQARGVVATAFEERAARRRTADLYQVWRTGSRAKRRLALGVTVLRRVLLRRHGSAMLWRLRAGAWASALMARADATETALQEAAPALVDAAVAEPMGQLGARIGALETHSATELQLTQLAARAAEQTDDVERRWEERRVAWERAWEERVRAAEDAAAEAEARAAALHTAAGEERAALTARVTALEAALGEKADRVEHKKTLEDILLVWRAVQGLKSEKLDKASWVSKDDDLRKLRARMDAVEGGLANASSATDHEKSTLSTLQKSIETNENKIKTLNVMLSILSQFVEEFVKHPAARRAKQAARGPLRAPTKTAPAGAAPRGAAALTQGPPLVTRLAPGDGLGPPGSARAAPTPLFANDECVAPNWHAAVFNDTVGTLANRLRHS